MSICISKFKLQKLVFGFKILNFFDPWIDVLLWGVCDVGCSGGIVQSADVFFKIVI